MNNVNMHPGIRILGCGLIGQQWANVIGAGGRLVVCADIDVGCTERLAKDSGARIFKVNSIF